MLLLAGVGGAGYWWGGQRAQTGNDTIGDAGTVAAPAAGNERKVLYYRNPMGLPDISPVPKQDAMGMDYVPVYADEQATGDAIKISLDKLQKLGVRTETAQTRRMLHTVRVVGIIEANEQRVYTIAPKFEGWIETLHVNSTGAAVRNGQALLEAYSPELVSAQQEYVIAWEGTQSLRAGSSDAQAGMQQLAQSSLERLRNWGISEEQLQRLRADGQIRRQLTLRSPVNGIVLEKMAAQGMRFMPGEVLYRLADLSSLWLIAKVFEQDLVLIQPGLQARITVNAFPDREFTGTVAFVYPTLDTQTRTAQVRIELPNPGGVLKPAMYANVELIVPHAGGEVLAVPDSAILDSGTRQLALIERGAGLFQPRQVKPGMRADGYVEILDGLANGDKVVVSANFLIDAESNLKAALGGFGGATASGSRDAAAAHSGHDAPAAHDGHDTPATTGGQDVPAAHAGH